MTENNLVHISGIILRDPELNHEILGEKFYMSEITVKRKSGTLDILPVMVSDREVNIDCITEGVMIETTGSFRSHNQHNEDGSYKHVLYVFMQGVKMIDTERIEGEYDNNAIELNGYICKPPKYRTTPLGRQVTDLIIAVNRGYGKSDYIPCIAWGRNAVYASSLEVGTKIYCKGRVQSRIYLKNDEERTAYEVSLSAIKVTERDAEP